MGSRGVDALVKSRRWTLERKTESCCGFLFTVRVEGRVQSVGEGQGDSMNGMQEVQGLGVFGIKAFVCLWNGLGGALQLQSFDKSGLSYKSPRKFQTADLSYILLEVFYVIGSIFFFFSVQLVDGGQSICAEQGIQASVNLGGPVNNLRQVGPSLSIQPSSQSPGPGSSVLFPIFPISLGLSLVIC